MGMDLMGLQPKNADGEYFGANLWAWRPMHVICDLAIEQSSLDISTEGWEYNDGKGVKTQEKCDELADAITEYMHGFRLKEDSPDRAYLCLGMWVVDTGEFLSDEEEEKLNTDYPPGTVLVSQVISKEGKLVQPAHSISVERVKVFVNFLRNCGGFEIY